MPQVQERDTVPRLHKVIDHAQDQLAGIASGRATFEECRLQYGETQRRLDRQGRGRLTASRLPETERNWSPTVDALSELMRWGAVVQDKLPSARSFLDTYRTRRYELTEHGRELAALAEQGGAAFVDRVTDALVAAHPYLRSLLRALSDGPIVCPVVSEGDVERGRAEGFGAEGWGRWGAERIGAGADTRRVVETIRNHLRNRFGARPDERPSNKALSEALNDALAVSGFAARGLSLDAPTIKTLLRWGSELLLYDQSRYVPAHPDCNVIWLAADLDEQPDGSIRPRRRGLREYGDRVARALVDAYRDQAATTDSMLVEPYLPIHRVRAQAAFTCGVTRRLGDVVLAHLVDGDWPELGVTVLTHIGTSRRPDSEPPFRHNGRRRLEMTVTRRSKGA